MVNRLRQQWLRVPQSTFDGDAKLSLSYENVLFPFLARDSVYIKLICFIILIVPKPILLPTSINSKIVLNRSQVALVGIASAGTLVICEFLHFLMKKRQFWTKYVDDLDA